MTALRENEANTRPPAAQDAPAAGPFTWAIVTGEYPPKRGGVSDYTRQLAHTLAAAGDEVHVWTPEGGGAAGLEQGELPVRLHLLPGHFGLRALRRLHRELKALPDSRRLLIQYVPHAYGWKAMNVLFCVWLAWGSRRRPLWVMYHEVAFPLSRSQSLKHNALGAVTKAMAFLLARAAERIFVSIPAWQELLPQGPPPGWLPIPSGIPTGADPAAIREFRRRVAPEPGQVLIGHFGTYGPHVEPRLEIVLPRLLTAGANRIALLAGQGGERAAAGLIRAHPQLKDRIIATGALPGPEAAVALSACDLLVQPFTDGANGRRSSLMAGLALGLPIVTTAGPRTEPVWKEYRAVAIAPLSSADAFVAKAEEVLADPEYRKRLRVQSAKLYWDQFDLAKTIHRLRGATAARGPLT